MKKWKAFLRIGLIILALLIARLIIDIFKIDVLTETSLIGCFIGGTLFVIAITLAGVLSDFKESEKLIDDLAACIKNIYSYGDVLSAPKMQTHIKELLHILILNFSKGIYNYQEIALMTNELKKDLVSLKKRGVDSQYMTALLTELANIDRISNRIDTIAVTSFVPASYVVSDISVGASILLLLFVKLDTLCQSLALVGAVSFILITLLVLIRDMDNPFDFGDTSIADVDTSILSLLEENLIKQSH